MAGLDDVLTTEDLAERYKLSAEAIRGWRYRRTGPAWFKAGKRIFYRPEAVAAWEREREAFQQASA